VKKHLNTVYVTTNGAYLSLEGESILVKVDGEIKGRLPMHMLESVVCFGYISCSPQLMFAASERGICIAWFSEYGRFLARVGGPVSGNILLRKAQYRRSEDLYLKAVLARSFVLGKVANCRTVLQRSSRDHPQSSGADVQTAIEAMAYSIESASGCSDVDTLRGIEGMAANHYYRVFDRLVLVENEAFRFNCRSRRPPLDRVNALLSFIYTMLVHDCISALEGVGLDPQAGFLHADRSGRPSLALDLMEEFRAYIADRLVLSLINRRQILATGFTQTESGAVLMDDDTRKKVLIGYQERKSEELRHPFLDEHVTVGMLPHLQARLLARHLRGDIDAYPPFFMK
jgi:CRISPR-associated protein Cas1